jgi:hypothetical protein
MILFCWEIRKLKKRKTAKDRCDTRGMNREFKELKKIVNQRLREELGR